MGIEIEVITDEFSIVLRTDSEGYNPTIAQDMVDRLPGALAHVEAHLLVVADDEDDEPAG